MSRKKAPISYKTAAANRAKKDKYFKIASLILFFILWEAIGYLNGIMGWIEPKFLPVPTGIIRSAYTFFTDGTLMTHVGISVYRVCAGYAAGVVIAIILGSLIACFKAADTIFSPILNLFGPIPIMAFLPMFILWFGIGEKSKIILIAYATIIYLISYVTEGIKNTDPVLIRSAVSLGANQWQLFTQVKFKSAFPNIFLGMKGALGTAFGAMVVAEMMGASTGLGYIIVFSKNWFKMDDMMMAAIVIGLLYSLMYAILSVIESKLFRWKNENTASAVEK